MAPHFFKFPHLVDEGDVTVGEEPVAHEPLGGGDDEEQVQGVAHAVEGVVVLKRVASALYPENRKDWTCENFKVLAIASGKFLNLTLLASLKNRVVLVSDPQQKG